MNKQDYKTALFSLLEQDVEGLDFEERMKHTEKLLLKFQIKHDKIRKPKNKGKEWSDEQLKVILSDAPTKSNCLKYARLFQRGYGSIEQIYRWSTTTQQDVELVRPDDKFVQQIKRVAKELGLRG